MYTLILLSGGVGTRMNNTIPKQYMLLAGKPVIMHILERVNDIEEISEVIIVCAEEYINSIKLMCEKYGITKNTQFAIAGHTRQESVKNGLRKVRTNYVLLHEAARPFVKREDFKRLIESPYKNITYGIKIPFTVLIGEEKIVGILDRKELVNVQLPQKFEFQPFSDAHDKAYSEKKSFTEDASLLFYFYPEIPIKIMDGMEYDIKLTTRQDLLQGEIIYQELFAKR